MKYAFVCISLIGMSYGATAQPSPATDSINSSTQKTEQLRSVLVKGNILSITGLIMHISGYALETVISFPSTNLELRPKVSNPVLLLHLTDIAFIIGGPIVSCIGASTVKNAEENAGFRPDKLRVWGQYTDGWLCFLAGSGLGCIALLVGIGAAFGGNDNMAPAEIIGIAAGGFIVWGEIKWVQCMVNSITYSRQYKNALKKNNISLHLVPVFDLKGGKGLSLVAYF